MSIHSLYKTILVQQIIQEIKNKSQLIQNKNMIYKISIPIPKFWSEIIILRVGT